MKAKDLTRSRYKDIQNLEKDELIYCLVYELAIRAAKDEIIEKMKMFSLLDNGKIDLVQDEIFKQFGENQVSEFQGTSQQLFIDILKELQYSILFRWDIDILNGFWEYHFIPEETQMILQNLQKYVSKEKYFFSGKSTVYYGDGFIRSEVTKIEDNEEKDIVYTYYPRYKRPKLITNFDQSKKVNIEIDVNLPDDALKLQLNRLVSAIQKDSSNILTKQDVFLKTIGKDYLQTFTKPFEQKGIFVDMLLAYDYDQLRREEIEVENKIRQQNKNKEIKYIKDSLLGSSEKKTAILEIKKTYKQIPLSTIFDDLAYSLNIASGTAKKHIEQIKQLIKDKNYLKLHNGIIT